MFKYFNLGEDQRRCLCVPGLIKPEKGHDEKHDKPDWICKSKHVFFLIMVNKRFTVKD